MAEGKGTPTSEQEKEAQQSKPWMLRELGGKSVWDWLQLLIVPLALVGIGLVFDLRQQDVEDQRAARERDLAEQRAQDEALQAYFDQMSTLLLEKDLRLSIEGKATVNSIEARVLARARTLTVLPRLDGDRKANVVVFLHEADLINENQPVFLLKGADLSRADLRYADLSEPGIDLSGAKLIEANLDEADLSDANLAAANIPHADLSDAYMVNADLSYATLSPGYFKGLPIPPATNLSGADLSHADLTRASVNLKQLEQAKSLEGATMPDGQILKSDDNPDRPTFEDWLKHAENPNPPTSD